MLLWFFTDVIQAYKGVQKEKEALEASLNALAQSKSLHSDDEPNPTAETTTHPDPNEQLGDSAISRLPDVRKDAEG